MKKFGKVPVLILLLLMLSLSGNTQEHSLPVIHLETEPEYLWDNEIGMYAFGDDYETDFPYFGANFWEDWEYPFTFKYFDANGNLTYEADAGGKIFGGYSRAHPQRPFSLFARKQYGTGSFKYKFFDSRPYSSFEAFVLRTSGNDWYGVFFKDAFITSLAEENNQDVQAYRPTVMYLNGEYWGIYNLREKVNEHFLSSLHHIESHHIDLLERNAKVIHGSDDDYKNLLSYIEDHSLADVSNYEYINSQIDIDNFIKYQATEIYFANRDWPNTNNKYWKSKHGKWRWILFDLDSSMFNPEDNTLACAIGTQTANCKTSQEATLILRKLLENDEFKIKFINHFADMMNSICLPVYAHAYIDIFADRIEDEMPNHTNRWGRNLNEWYEDIEGMKTFLTDRPSIMKDMLQTKFGLPSHHKFNIHINKPEQGRVQVNSLIVEISDWEGKYFEGNPVTLKAIAKPGFSFDHWSGDIQSSDPEITVNPTKEISVAAHFIKNQNTSFPIVINEINYNSPDHPNASDWVELFNTSNQPVILTNWIFKDSKNSHSFEFPKNTIFNPGEYLVLCKDLINFKSVHPSVKNVIGNFDFGLSSSGDEVRLFDESGNIMDSVAYLPVSPWPQEANGNGQTLELISPDLDNTLPQSWEAHIGYGTPGRKNHINPSFNSRELVVYPNPGTDHIYIQLKDQDKIITSVSIYDMLGRLQFIDKSFNQNQIALIDISGLPKGLYAAMVGIRNGDVKGVLVEKM